MSGIVWEEPPGRVRRGHYDWRAIASDLRAHCGRWARVAEYDTPGSAAATASRISKGKRPPFGPAGTFEAASRKAGDGWAVYARYVGEAPEAGS